MSPAGGYALAGRERPRKVTRCACDVRADARAVWVLYFASVAWLAVRLFRPTPAGATARRRGLALALAVPSRC